MNKYHQDSEDLRIKTEEFELKVLSENSRFETIRNNFAQTQRAEKEALEQEKTLVENQKKVYEQYKEVLECQKKVFEINTILSF